MAKAINNYFVNSYIKINFLLFILSFFLSTNNSILLGCYSFLIPNLVATFIIFLASKESKSLILFFYFGQFIKFILSVIFFLCAFSLFEEMYFFHFFLSYFLCAIMNSVICFVLNIKKYN